MALEDAPAAGKERGVEEGWNAGQTLSTNELTLSYGLRKLELAVPVVERMLVGWVTLALLDSNHS